MLFLLQSFIAYARAIDSMKLKEVFDVTQIDFEALAKCGLISCSYPISYVSCLSDRMVYQSLREYVSYGDENNKATQHSNTYPLQKAIQLLRYLTLK